MSEQSSSPQETADSLSASPTVMQPQNQWALIRRSFRKRELAVLSLYGIVFLITISIFAPFIANDRPITYRGVNKFEYNLSYLYLTSQLHRLTTPPKVEDPEETTTPDKPIKKSIKSILLFQIDLMSTHLKSTQAKELSKLRQQLVSIADSTVSIEEKKADVKEFRALLKKSFDPKTVTLQTKRYWPVISSLNGTEIAFMLFNLAMLSFPLYRRISTKYFPKQQFVVAVMMLFVVPAIAGTLWWMSFPYRLDRTNYKSAVMVADAKQNPQSHVLFESSLWPPIRHGIDGYNLDAINALPGFTTSANEGSIWDTPYWFGTDGIGRDLATRMIWGGRISLAVGIVAVSIYVTIGIIIGSIAGYFGGIVDLLLSRFIEMVIVFPSFFLILTVIAFVGPSIFNIIMLTESVE